MIEQRFIDKIEDLRHHTYSRIIDLQKNLCPMVKRIYLNFQFEYWYEGYKYNLWEDDTHVYAVNEIPYCYDNELKNTTFIDTLNNLVNDGKVWPFLLFIDGVVIQWSKITVIHDYNYSYFKISGITPDTSTYANIIVFPLNGNEIRYGEDNNVLTTPDKKGFYFGSNGKRLEQTDFVDISLRLELLKPDLYYKEVLLTGNILEFQDLPDGYIPTLDNMIAFNSDGSYNHTGPSEKIEDSYNSSYGLFNIKNTNSNIKWIILMYNTKDTNKSSSYLYSKANVLNRRSIVKLLTENPKETSQEIWDDVIIPLIRIFDFDHTFGKNYDQNLHDAAKYITRYDFALWKDVFKNSINIKSITYTGIQFKELSDDKGFVHLSRKHSDLIEDSAIVFVNNRLYKYTTDITHVNNTINIPIFDIDDNDHIEIILYTKCNNNILDIKVEDSNIPIYIHPEYNLEDCDIMSDECPDAIYPMPIRSDGKTQYTVKFNYTVDDKSNYKIEFENDEYYGKSLKVVPKRQFRYYQFKEKTNQFKFALPNQFNYCHDPDKYLVFINGKKIDRTEYTITIMNENRPFDSLQLYIATLLDEGDYIDIFYIPEGMKEKYKQESIPNSGLLILEDNFDHINYPNTYPLSKDTTMIFVNGLKVNPLDIKDISMNCLLFGVDKYERNLDGTIKRDRSGNPIVKKSYVDSITNITIDEYLIGNKDISGYLKGLYEQIPEGEDYDPSKIDFNKSASDAWKDLIKTIIEKYSEVGSEYVGLQKLFGPIFELDDPAEDYKENFTSLKNVLYDAIIEYYLSREEATTGEQFVYDFDPNIDPDSPDVVKEINLVPDKDKLADYDVELPIANPEDVLNGKQFDI